uniref:Uncharacterized protein n=1 Tax=virus sp. ctEfN2 TaxID=2825810 RepID=A0A8S5RN48_9VIRU|nr:MAG TPA: hypothetical protein [virus sp. ctEfN2]
MINIILSDGTEIKNLTVNGTCLISDVDVADELLTDEKLQTITINNVEYKNITLARKWIDEDKIWIALREKTQSELDKERIAELESVNVDLSATIDSILTEILPSLGA